MAGLPIFVRNRRAIKVDSDSLTSPFPLLVLLNCVEEKMIAGHVPVHETAAV